jgi:2-keto-4-pentenoate hydratase/2-oxohepta-3-ene-1,7-dioic acid hydratase in catechol pathway
MKLVRYGEKGRERPGLVDSDGGIRDLSGHVTDIAGDVLTPEGLAQVSRIATGELPRVPHDARIGPCIGRVGKIVCVGLNYRDHAAEAGMAVPDEPVLFMKATSAITGPYDDVKIPRASMKTDWEVELGVVIGKAGAGISLNHAFDHVAGYCIINDISERSYQLERGGQWVKGKSHDTFAPIGPWFVTADEVLDPQALDLFLEVDGNRCQNSSTREMIFGVGSLVSYISEFMSLQTGDIICTGTPPGVGMGFRPPRFLSAGQVMRLGISGLGLQQCRTVMA